MTQSIFAQILPHSAASSFPNVMLAPMSGITDRPFRRAVRRAGGGMVVSEMVASHAVLNNVRPEMEKLRFSAQEEAPLSVQLAGWDPDIMAQAAQIAEQMGASMIDINMGCPAKKVTGRSAGSALMAEPERAAQICDAVVRAVNLPVSLKMRLGVDENHLNAAQIAQYAEQAGIVMLAIHARTRAQMYTGHARWAMAKEAVQSVHIPVFINGDICNAQDARQAMDYSHAHGVMIGRAAQGRPWLLRQIQAELEGDTQYQPPGLKEIRVLIHTHLEDVFSHYGQRGIRLVRKHLASYCDGLPHSLALREQWMCAETMDDIFEASERYFTMQEAAA